MLSIRPGEKVFRKGIYYKGKIKVNLAGEWVRGLREPLWVITNLQPEAALTIYKARMKIEQAFRDLKSLLRWDKIMNKTQRNMERMTAIVLLAYAIALLIGEDIREHIYQGKKSKLYSGLFILLKHRIRLARETIGESIARAYSLLSTIILGNVRTNV
jgi:transposase